ncbi:MAG: hypothetical protein AAF050_01945 [Cyanobacteria bacterium J06649_5]
MNAFITWLSEDSTKAWIVAITTSIGAILAWVTKLKWAEEYKTVVKAKMALADEQLSVVKKNAALADELNKKQIEFAENQVRSLAEFAPSKMQEHFSAIRQIERERIETLANELASAQQEISDKNRIIDQLQQQQTGLETTEIEKLQEAKNILNRKVEYLNKQLADLQGRDQEIIQILNFMERPEFPIDTIKEVLERFDSRKRWVLSETKERLEKEKRERQAQANRAHSKRAKPSKIQGRMSRAAPLDET